MGSGRAIASQQIELWRVSLDQVRDPVLLDEYANLLAPVERRQQQRFHFERDRHRYLLTHGDSLGVKGGDGLIGALGPIMRGTIKLNRQESQIGRDFDTAIMGHWHQYLTLPGLIVNNSLKGYDEFSHLALRAPYSRPSQALWFTHPEHGITAHWQVYLEGRKRFERASDEWVTWQKN
jgi:hypothetical protein